MEISSPKPKKFLIFFSKKKSYISRENLQRTKNKKIHPEEILYIFPKNVLLTFRDGC